MQNLAHAIVTNNSAHETNAHARRLQVKLVLQRNKFWVESPDLKVLKLLHADSIINAAAVATPPGAPKFAVSAGALLPLQYTVMS